MENESEFDNVILFPKWKKTLEEESLQALKEKKYETALLKLNKLLSYQVNSHEIIIAKLICLMELERHSEAQDICEVLLNVKDENYYHYVHIYLTILFQTNQYELLMEQVEQDLRNEDLPAAIKEQFQQLYDMSDQMKNDVTIEKTTAYLDELNQAIDDNNHVEQWRIIQKLRKEKAQSSSDIIKYLMNEKVHPVTKTAMFQWLQDQGITYEVDIHKLDSQIRVVPANILDIASHSIVKQTLLQINELEQKDPSLFILLKQILYRYAYVRYPIMPPNDDVVHIAEALKHIGQEYLNIHIKMGERQSDTIIHYTEEIKACETLYMSMIEE